MTWPHLAKAPIHEALIDIQVKLASDFPLASLKEIQKRIVDRYPKIQERHRWEGKLEFSPGSAPTAASNALGVDGYLFTSADDREVVQMRLDGFTFSRLRPYQDWGTLRAEAKRLWDIYVAVAEPSIFRVAVRYTNVLKIPHIGDLKDYLKSPPVVPAGISANLTSFLNRLIVMESSVGATAIITSALESAPTPAEASIILDIDVFKHAQFDSDYVKAWAEIDGFQEIKNNVFFNSITKKTEEIYQ